jgi:hypothetical protein
MSTIKKLIKSERLISVALPGEHGRRVVGFVIECDEWDHLHQPVAALRGLVNHWKAANSQSQLEEPPLGGDTGTAEQREAGLTPIEAAIKAAEEKVTP